MQINLDKNSPQQVNSRSVANNAAIAPTIKVKGTGQQAVTQNSATLQLEKYQQMADAGMANTHRPGSVVQRITIALGDLQEAANKKQTLTEGAHAHAKVITDAEAAYRKNSGEAQAHPWDERFRPFKAGPLAAIGNENIRIYGHGATYEGDNVVSMVGGYTPEAIIERLVKMGLPSNYAGEVYLTGCETAIGPAKGFLGKFYALLIKQFPKATARGNLGTTTTFPDGRQGVWTGVLTEEYYQKTRAKINEKNLFYLEKNRTLGLKVRQLLPQDESLNQELARLTASKADAVIMNEFTNRRKKLDEVISATVKAVEEVADLIKNIAKGIREFDEIAYDVTGKLSVTLPAQLNEARDVSKAREIAKNNEEFRLTRLEIAEELAAMYGWGESTVTKKVYGGELDDRARTRMDSRKEERPSYIS